MTKKQTFPSTHWSLILDDDRRKECLEELASKYWSAIYLYARKFGHDQEAAKDISQELFIELQTGDLLKKADPQKGKFRAYLIGILKNLCKRNYRRQMKHRKYADKLILSFDNFQETYEHSAMNKDITPEEAFNREWARLIIHQAFTQLKEYCYKGDKKDRQDAFEAFQMQYFDDVKASEIAEKLDRDVKWVSEKIYRLKQKFGEIVRGIVAETLEEGESLEQEIQQIMSYL